MQRLKKRSQFQAVLAGSRVAATEHFVLHRRALDDSDVKASAKFSAAAAPASPQAIGTEVLLGAMVPKRWAKRAVTRNTIKRLIYNVSAEFESALPSAAHVVRLRTAFDLAGFISATSFALKQALRAELRQLFEIATRGGGGSGSSKALQC